MRCIDVLLETKSCLCLLKEIRYDVILMVFLVVSNLVHTILDVISALFLVSRILFLEGIVPVNDVGCFFLFLRLVVGNDEHSFQSELESQLHKIHHRISAYFHLNQSYALCLSTLIWLVYVHTSRRTFLKQSHQIILDRRSQ